MPNRLTVDVVDVTDGDTFVAAGAEGNTITVRVWSIDAPESGQPYGPGATRVAREVINGDLVDVHVQDTGPYGRHIGRVRTEYEGNDVVLGRSLTLSGLAWHSRNYPTSDVLVQHEEEARRQNKGLWSQANSVPPWEWRDRTSGPGERSAEDGTVRTSTRSRKHSGSSSGTNLEPHITWTAMGTAKRVSRCPVGRLLFGDRLEVIVHVAHPPEEY